MVYIKWSTKLSKYGGTQCFQPLDGIKLPDLILSVVALWPPEAGVVVCVQVGGIRPADAGAFTSQFDVLSRVQRCGPAQSQEASFIQHLGQ